MIIVIISLFKIHNVNISKNSNTFLVLLTELFLIILPFMKNGGREVKASLISAPFTVETLEDLLQAKVIEIRLQSDFFF